MTNEETETNPNAPAENEAPAAEETLADLDKRTRGALAADIHRAMRKILKGARARKTPYQPDEVVAIIEAFRNVVLSLIAKGQ